MIIFSLIENRISSTPNYNLISIVHANNTQNILHSKQCTASFNTNHNAVTGNGIWTFLMTNLLLVVILAIDYYLYNNYMQHQLAIYDLQCRYS